jgi:hypothetical protein
MVRKARVSTKVLLALNYYFIVLGVAGLALLQAIYYVLALMVLKLGPRPEHQRNAAREKPSEN